MNTPEKLRELAAKAGSLAAEIAALEHQNPFTANAANAARTALDILTGHAGAVEGRIEQAAAESAAKAQEEAAAKAKADRDAAAHQALAEKEAAAAAAVAAPEQPAPAPAE